MKTMSILLLSLTTAVSSWGAGGVTFKRNIITTSNRTETATIEISGTAALTGWTVHDFTFDNGLKKKPLEERIREAEQRLNKLYFIRDVCPKLEEDIALKFDKMELREVLKQVSEKLGAPLPYKLPEGRFEVGHSDVTGMPADQFIEAVADIVGLKVVYERDRIRFVKKPTPHKGMPRPKVEKGKRERSNDTRRE